MPQKHRTLYVSDLDGTLLRPDQKTSPFTNQTIQQLVEQGLYFSYATARSFITASRATAGLHARIPLILYNGAFVLDSETRRILFSNFFPPDEIGWIRSVLDAHRIHPIVYAYIDGNEKFSYHTMQLNGGMRAFLDSRKGDIRERPVTSDEELYRGQIFYFTCIDREETLYPAFRAFENRFQLVYQKELYSGEPWLEILPRSVSKAAAVLWLKEYLGCDRIISFGDGVNDLPMFRVSDECYAVENAVDELKQLATGIIGSNEEDGVAKWLLGNAAL